MCSRQHMIAFRCYQFYQIHWHTLLKPSYANNYLTQLLGTGGKECRQGIVPSHCLCHIRIRAIIIVSTRHACWMLEWVKVLTYKCMAIPRVGIAFQYNGLGIWGGLHCPRLPDGINHLVYRSWKVTSRRKPMQISVRDHFGDIVDRILYHSYDRVDYPRLGALWSCTRGFSGAIWEWQNSNWWQPFRIWSVWFHVKSSY